MKLYVKILLAVSVGLVFGVFLDKLSDSWPEAASWVMLVLEPAGRIFLKLINMVIIPLVMASLLLGIASLGDVRKLGRIGMRSLLFFSLTTAAAVAIGLALAVWFQPGKLVDTNTLKSIGGAAARVRVGQPALGGGSIVDMVLDIVPPNPVKAIVEGNMLQVIFFTLFLGVALSFVSEERRRFMLDAAESVNEAMVVCIRMIMRIAPYCVFAMMAMVVGRYGYEVLFLLAGYCWVVVLGQLMVVLLVDLVPVWVYAGIPPWRFLAGVKEAMLLAFSTSSSSATLPVTMECCEEKLGIPNEITSFVAPLGATVNMNGTALYQGVSALFIAQVYGVDLGLNQMLTIVLTATLSAVGCAAVPGVGMITLAMVLKSVGLPLEGIGLILGVDRLLDMVRTVVNVTGDMSCAAVVASAEGVLRKVPRGKIDEDVLA